MCALSLAFALGTCGAADAPAPRPGVAKFLHQELGAIKPIAAGAALEDGGLRDPFPIPSDDAPLLGETGPAPCAAPPLPPAPAFLGGLNRFAGAPRFSAADGRMVLPTCRSTYSFNALPKATDGYALRHALGIEWAPPSAAFGLAARFAANGLTSDQAAMVGDAGIETKAVILQAAGLTAVGGVALDAPFGARLPGTPRPDAVAGPFVAALLARPGNPWFVQMAERLDVALGGDEPLRLRTSVGLGHWLTGDGNLVSAWAPSVELHADHPLRGIEPARWNAALGATAYFGGGAAFGFAVGAPLSAGRRALDGRVHLSWRY